MLVLQLADYGVALTDLQECLAVVVEREDPLDLRQGPMRVPVLAEEQLDGDRSVGLVLAQQSAGVAAAAVDRERQSHRTVELELLALLRAESKLRRRPERERPVRQDLRVHAYTVSAAAPCCLGVPAAARSGRC